MHFPADPICYWTTTTRKKYLFFGLRAIYSLHPPHIKYFSFFYFKAWLLVKAHLIVISLFLFIVFLTCCHLDITFRFPLLLVFSLHFDTRLLNQHLKNWILSKDIAANSVTGWRLDSSPDTGSNYFLPFHVHTGSRFTISPVQYIPRSHPSHH